MLQQAAPCAAFALCRPPGHHCHEDRALGFCFLNNVAVAARHAQRQHGVRRVAIIDWDVHAGDGTERIFAGDDSVLVVSLHRGDRGKQRVAKDVDYNIFGG